MKSIALAIFFPALLFADNIVLGDDIYLNKVKTILQARCYACHGALKQASGLRLDTAVAAITGGDSGPAVVPNQSQTSPLWSRVQQTDPGLRMPPEGEPLKAEEIALIAQWIDSGAVAPDGESPETDPAEHWAFRAPEKKALPTNLDSQWNTNPIDAWIHQRHQVLQLKPQPVAPKSVWLRRVYLDLIGLPPTPDQLQSFENDTSEEAMHRVVDQLLESPQYGERWGRHWMDIWRYSDAWGLGAEMRNSQKHLWHWRDWIVESLNTDKPYNEMLREMLAADELYPSDPSRLRATGFLARHYFKFNRTTWLDETVEHTSKAMLGLTVNCAKCHDHKYDPLTQVEYYQLRSFFEPYQVRTDMIQGETDFEKDGMARAFDCNLEAPTYLHVRGDDRNPDKNHLLSPILPAFLAPESPRVETVPLPPTSQYPSLNADVAEAYRSQYAKERAAALQELELARSHPDAVDAIKLAELKHTIAQAECELLEARLMADLACATAPSPIPPEHYATPILKRASKLERQLALRQSELRVLQLQKEWNEAAPEKKAEKQSALDQAQKQVETRTQELAADSLSYRSPRGSLKTVESNLEDEVSRNKPFPRTSTGRRRALASWIASDQNPLTARVGINHIWARHFGQPLVETVFDFGRKGRAPAHPELLDWLAVDWMEHGWSMQYIHRMMVTSQTYRLSSSSLGADDVNLLSDKENKCYWRFPTKRMESQVVRDSLLHLAGELDLRLGGRSIPATDETSRRRSLYFYQSHNEHNEFLSMFDDANVMDCYRRTESIVPQQSLALANSKLVNEIAGAIARRIAGGDGSMDNASFVTNAYAVILCSQPSPDEAKLMSETMSSLQTMHLQRNAGSSQLDSGQGTAEQSGTAADQSEVDFSRRELIRILLNHNDFITIR